MGVQGAYLKVARHEHDERPPRERVLDFNDFVRVPSGGERMQQASRCMNCGVPFCQSGMCFPGAKKPTGCPLHNLIPETNDLLCHGRIEEAAQRLELTNPFPEFTGRICPAPCEVACNLGLHDDPVTIRDNERVISDYMWGRGTGDALAVWTDAPLVSVVGSGPAGLAAAWRLARRGARVHVYECDDRPGGLLMYGIPNMKLPKDVVMRRVRLMEEIGIEFSCGVDAGDMAQTILASSSAVVLAVGARVPRSVDVPGSQLGGVHFALDYLCEATRSLLDGREPAVTARGKDVVVIGGGDTGVDCVATALRQGAASVRQVVRAAMPPTQADVLAAWPGPRQMYEQGYGQCEAQELFGNDPRVWSTDTLAFLEDDGRVCAVRLRDVAGNAEAYDVPAQLVLVAKGFLGPDKSVLEAFGVEGGKDGAGSTSGDAAPREGRRCAVYLAGDARQGPAIVASAMADGMRVADGIAAEILS